MSVAKLHNIRDCGGRQPGSLEVIASTITLIVLVAELSGISLADGVPTFGPAMCDTQIRHLHRNV
jgi:hypothetical protein